MTRRRGIALVLVPRRLARIRELTGLDASSTRGREELGVGLKTMRVLRVHASYAPAA